jgi:dihydrofolate synthase/folylpolyglutamate synthase
MGGRRDPTNVVTPAISAIVSIGFDHMGSLGNTIEEITLHKAGIIKEGVPVVIGPQVPLETVQNVADSLNAPLTVVPGGHESYIDENNAVCA